jgi:hypothetical protein
MYHRRISTATVFIILFTCIELIFASVAWRMFGQAMWEKLNEAFESDEDVSNEEEEEQVSIEDREEQQQTESQYTDDEYLTEEERDQ